jgi:hypothetical protein
LVSLLHKKFKKRKNKLKKEKTNISYKAEILTNNVKNNQAEQMRSKANQKIINLNLK